MVAGREVGRGLPPRERRPSCWATCSAKAWPGGHCLTAPHTAPRLIAARDGVDGLAPPRTADGGRDLSGLTAALNAPLMAAWLRRQDWSSARPVYHLALAAAAADDPLLSDGQWADIAAEYLHRIGLAPAAQGPGSRPGAGAQVVDGRGAGNPPSRPAAQARAATRVATTGHVAQLGRATAASSGGTGSRTSAASRSPGVDPGTSTCGARGLQLAPSK